MDYENEVREIFGRIVTELGRHGVLRATMEKGPNRYEYALLAWIYHGVQYHTPQM
jgi:hypothetical protein